MTLIAARLREGRDLLRRGAWAQAREVFALAHEESGDPAAAEGIAGAAWWLDDDTEVTARYEDAYRGYRAVGDDLGAGRVAAWLGNGALQLRGEAAVAQGWFQRAERLLAEHPESEEHGLLALFKGMAARFRGDIRETTKLADRAVEIGRRLGSPDLEIQGMALNGMARIGQGEVTDGMRLLDEAAAAALAGEVREVGSVWIPTCYLVQGCEQVRDWDRAEQWRVRVLDFCRRFDLGSPFSRCRTHYSTILLWRGDWAAAEAELLHAAKALRTQRPLFAAEAWVRLGELRRRQGRWEEAADLFASSRSLPAARIGQAELRLDSDDPEGALDIAGRLLDALGGAERGPVLEVFVRAGVRMKNPDVVAWAVEELAEIARVSGIEAVEAAARWARGIHRAALADTAGAVPLLEMGVALYERAGGPYDAARARLDLASALLTSGRAGLAAQEARAAQEVFERLGATADARRANRLVSRAQSTPSAELTPRQVEIVRLLAVGLTNAEIADRLVLSEHTIKRHVANILGRLALPSRAAAVAYASRTGLL